MRYSEIKEVYNMFTEQAAEQFGEITKADINEFLNWIAKDKDVQKEEWTKESKNSFPFDLEEIFLDYMKYEGFTEEEEEERNFSFFDQNRALESEYFQSVL